MRYALILAGGSGTRLWPMSREALPKQLIPFINGKSLLRLAFDRLKGLVDDDKRYICAGLQHEDVIRKELAPAGGAGDTRSAGFGFIGEPEGRDTLNAIALSCAIIAARDPEAVIAVVTADHIIEPTDKFRYILEQGFLFVESNENALATFGIKPTQPVTGFGYLELGGPIEGAGPGTRKVTAFKEKPDMDTAKKYVAAGPEKYLWNGGMFVWRASTFLRLCRKYVPENHAGVMRIADAFKTAPGGQIDSAAAGETLVREYGGLKKISVDYAIMEPASRDADVVIASVMMDLSWLDVGSWPAFGETVVSDDKGNAASGCRALFMDSSANVVVSAEDNHLVAAIGCEDLIVIHTADATLVCPKNRAEDIKSLQAEVKARFGEEYV